ncbi:hypothetical protein C8R45DRAFT_134389 [Mycena sanguinolenta]|nr:hypothetical protein C8R45DRAFT_134389 [Mycena sanguinolenta]
MLSLPQHRTYTMLILPSELILLICSDISNQDLWAMTQVSSLIRSVTILPFLARHHISESDIKSGRITLRSHSFFLILVVAHLHPIRRLAVDWLGETDDVSEMKEVVRTLGAILSSTDTIPDISIRPCPYWNGGHDIYILDLLGDIPQTATRTLIIIAGGSMDISYPSKIPPIHWSPIHSIRRSHSPTKILVIDYLIGLLMVFIIGSVNSTIAMAWIYQLFFGPSWDTKARLQKDLGQTVRYCFSLRLQTVDKALATVTVVSTELTPLPRAQTLRPVSGLGDEALSAVISAIELDSTSTRFEEKANIRYSDLLLFLHHHPNLIALELRLESIRASSLITPYGAQVTSAIASLSAPALYIPHLISVAPLLTNISIQFHPTGAYFGPCIYLCIPEYKRALESIASFPGTHALFLSLSFPADAKNLPWLKLTDDDIASAPEREDLARASSLAATIPWPEEGYRCTRKPTSCDASFRTTEVDAGNLRCVSRS